MDSRIRFSISYFKKVSIWVVLKFDSGKVTHAYVANDRLFKSDYGDPSRGLRFICSFVCPRVGCDPLIELPSSTLC